MFYYFFVVPFGLPLPLFSVTAGVTATTVIGEAVICSAVLALVFEKIN